VAYDYGIKKNILRRLASFGCRITVVPATWPASEVLKMNPDGVFFSNGPVREETLLCMLCCAVLCVLAIHGDVATD
jgi:carbamoylphosphate synthase small subunit